MGVILFCMVFVPIGLCLLLSLEQLVIVYIAMILIGLIASLLSYLSTSNNKYNINLRFLDDLLGVILSIIIGTFVYCVLIGMIQLLVKYKASGFESALDSIFRRLML